MFIPICWWILEVFVEALSHSHIDTLYKVNQVKGYSQVGWWMRAFVLIDESLCVDRWEPLYKVKGYSQVDFVQSGNLWMAKSLHKYFQYPSTYWDIGSIRGGSSRQIKTKVKLYITKYVYICIYAHLRTHPLWTWRLDPLRFVDAFWKYSWGLCLKKIDTKVKLYIILYVYIYKYVCVNTHIHIYKRT